jgi:SAM-dependent methyltransferase
MLLQNKSKVDIMEIYNRDYFERGLETGKSCYQNYRWIPELTIPMAMTIIDFLDLKPGHQILDFGCAKGYLVKALRWLNREAWGIDISNYAIDNCDPEVKDFCYRNNGSVPYMISWRDAPFDWCIAKDVFEHIGIDWLECFLISRIATRYFVIVPLGDYGEFRAPANNLDTTHITCMTENQWSNFFYKLGFQIEDFRYRIDGIKDSYYQKYPTAHGFFTLC